MYTCTLSTTNKEYELSKRGHMIGGGLGDVFNAFGQSLYNTAVKPFEIPWNLASNMLSPYTSKNKESDHSKLLASAIKQTYETDLSKRSDYVGPLVRDTKMSTKYMDVWVDKVDGEKDFVLVTVRGTKNKDDVA